jgi:hypothetical protein
MMAQEERSEITEEGRPDEREIRKPDEVLEFADGQGAGRQH